MAREKENEEAEAWGQKRRSRGMGEPTTTKALIEAVPESNKH